MTTIRTRRAGVVPAALLRGLLPGVLLVLTVMALLAPPAARGQSGSQAGHPSAAVEPPMLLPRILSGALPPLAERLPAVPYVDAMDRPGLAVGRHGGDLTMLMANPRDIRMLTVYGYARLVGYDADYNLVPDILEKMEVRESRIFTMTLREGHRWSDGAPFTTEDFRYYWDDVANNPDLSPVGPDIRLKVDGEWPTVEILDERTVRYSWSRPNPDFLIHLAGPSPLYIYRPAHYLKPFHASHADPEEIEERMEAARRRNWASLHNGLDNQYANDNPALPTLDPWVNTTESPADRFVFVRNPYFHRVDPQGRQLPYIDRVIVNMADSNLIPAKAGSGESDLQARYLDFADFTFLRAGTERGDYDVRLWRTALGNQVALYPNLTVTDPGWRAILREADFRRALSLAIDRDEINAILFAGLAFPSNNTVLPQSPLFRQDYQSQWATYDIRRANALLDGLGLTARNGDGTRLLPDGRPLDIIIETSGERAQEVDILQLIKDSWARIGVRIFIKPSQREVMRNRIFAGVTLMSVWTGLDNGVATAAMSPHELVPIDQIHLQWPKWGQYFQTNGAAGEPPDTVEGRRLLSLYGEWREASSDDGRRRIWQQILEINADQVFTIGTVAGVLQPLVVKHGLRNVPKEGVFAWDPGARFGIYHPDRFWWE
ncbi:MAG: ABC transporter substrate-binding protein [Alphaproteobacteria bacterium]